MPTVILFYDQPVFSFLMKIRNLPVEPEKLTILCKTKRQKVVYFIVGTVDFFSGWAFMSRIVSACQILLLGVSGRSHQYNVFKSLTYLKVICICTVKC